MYSVLRGWTLLCMVYVLFFASRLFFAHQACAIADSTACIACKMVVVVFWCCLMVFDFLFVDGGLARVGPPYAPPEADFR